MGTALHVVCPHCGSINRVPTERLGDGPRCGTCRQLLLSGAPLELDGASLERHLSREGLPVLVDFWAPWCGPCRMMAPVFNQAAVRYVTRLRFARLNTEEHPQAAARFADRIEARAARQGWRGCGFAIRSIPTLALFNGAREVGRVSGALTAPQLEAWIERHLA